MDVAILYGLPLCTKWTEMTTGVQGLKRLDRKTRTTAGTMVQKQTKDEGMEEGHFRAKMLLSAVGRPDATNVRAT